MFISIEQTYEHQREINKYSRHTHDYLVQSKLL
jgi:hypothetical protein